MNGFDDSESAANDLEAAILAHLRAWPQAIDTARGVRDWWVGHIHPPPSQELVLSALQRLAQRGAVVRIHKLGQPELWASAIPTDGDT